MSVCRAVPFHVSWAKSEQSSVSVLFITEKARYQSALLWNTSKYIFMMAEKVMKGWSPTAVDRVAMVA